jgi:putative DNA primase/helicase
MPPDNVLQMTDQTPNPPPGGAPAPPAGGKGRTRRKSTINLGTYTRLMESFALIYSTKTAWDEESHRIVPIDALRLAMTSDAVKAWLNSPTRRMVMPEQLMFEPGQELPEGCIQLFGGLEVEPLACSAEEVTPMLDLLRHLCADSADTPDGVRQVMHWVLRWQALPLQQLGAKMQTAIVMHGPQGTGKNLYWDVWRDLYGRHGITVGQTELEDKFNGWLSQKLAIIGDEVVSRQEMYHNKNRLKLIVTQEQKFPIREIQQATRWESNHANVVFLSNESQPLALEERDRRYMVIYTPLAADASLYERVAAFLRADGARRWLHFLMHYPLGDFNRHTKPLPTKAKADLIQSGWLPAQRFAHEWAAGYLPLPLRVCSAEQLYRAFARWCTVYGERFPPSQGRFTSEVQRWLREHSGADERPRLHYKVVQLHDTNGRRAVRCWLPAQAAPPEGMSEGMWAADSVRAFESVLRDYLRDITGSDLEAAA